MNEKIISILLSIAMIGGGTIMSNDSNEDSNTSSDVTTHLESTNNNYIPEQGFVPDEITAVKIAEAVLLPIYGETIYDNQPFKAKYIDTEECWVVYGTLKENSLGGVPEIKIEKNNGTIIYVTHSK